MKSNGDRLDWKWMGETPKGDMAPTQLESFNECRPMLLELSRRILGAESEAEDLVQEAYLRWRDTDLSAVKSPKAFLATMVTRLSLNNLKLARVRLREPGGIAPDDLQTSSPSPDKHAELADALTEAFTRMAARLSGTERVVFLLREAFDFDYSEIAPIVERSEANCRQILKRARERLLRQEAPPGVTSEQDRRVAQVFRDAVQTGELEQLLSLLSDKAVLLRDAGNLSSPAPPPLVGLALREELGRVCHAHASPGINLRLGHLLGSTLLFSEPSTPGTPALLLQLHGGQIIRAQVVTCPALLCQLRLLSAYSFSE